MKSNIFPAEKVKAGMVFHHSDDPSNEENVKITKVSKNKIYFRWPNFDNGERRGCISKGSWDNNQQYGSFVYELVSFKLKGFEL